MQRNVTTVDLGLGGDGILFDSSLLDIFAHHLAKKYWCAKSFLDTSDLCRMSLFNAYLEALFKHEYLYKGLI